MKGDATVHTTNKKYRAGYDAIDWKGHRFVPDPQDELICNTCGKHLTEHA